MIRIITKKELDRLKRVELHAGNYVSEIDNNIAPCGIMKAVSLKCLRENLWPHRFNKRK